MIIKTNDYTPTFLTESFFETTEKKGDICDGKSQISPLKRQGKGSLLLPCSKKPIGIFLFSLKSEFQKVRKTSKNEENPRKSRVFRLASFLSRRIGGATRNRTGDEGFADLCLTAWLWRFLHHMMHF